MNETTDRMLAALVQTLKDRSRLRMRTMFAWWCRRFHHHRRGRDSHGKLVLVCDTCSRVFPIKIGDRQRARRLKQRMHGPATVVSLRDRRKTS
jgi:hypothetical protein